MNIQDASAYNGYYELILLYTYYFHCLWLISITFIYPGPSVNSRLPHLITYCGAAAQKYSANPLTSLLNIYSLELCFA